jgi:hypothetical protein
MSGMKAFLDEVQVLLECGYNADQISQALGCSLEMAEQAVEYWTDFAEVICLGLNARY